MRVRFALCSLLLCVLIGSTALAQDISAKITGTITDNSGALVTNGVVTAKQISQGVVFTTKTNAAGIYFLSQLPVGEYTMEVSAPGFATSSHPVFTLVLSQTARVDFALSVGAASQTVEVSSAPPLLQADQTFLGTVIDARANTALPLATRNYNQLTLLSPGAVSLNPGSFTGPQASFQVGTAVHQWQPGADEQLHPRRHG